MGQRYEYKFVRLGEYAGSAFGVSDKARNAYEDVVHEHARRTAGGSCRSSLPAWPRSAPPGTTS